VSCSTRASAILNLVGRCAEAFILQLADSYLVEWVSAGGKTAFPEAHAPPQGDRRDVTEATSCPTSDC
jgi:hypothetical protein